MVWINWAQDRAGSCEHDIEFSNWIRSKFLLISWTNTATYWRTPLYGLELAYPENSIAALLILYTSHATVILTHISLKLTAQQQHYTIFIILYCILSPIPLAEGSKATACMDCGFESRRRHGCLSLASVLSGRGLCVEPITRPGQFSDCVIVWSTCRNPRHKAALARVGLLRHGRNVSCYMFRRSLAIFREIINKKGLLFWYWNIQSSHVCNKSQNWIVKTLINIICK